VAAEGLEPTILRISGVGLRDPKITNVRLARRLARDKLRLIRSNYRVASKYLN
jgi:hypothetical protein